MIAVLSHELKTYFTSLTAYVFGAFLLVFTGIGAMMYNINSAVSNFEYVLSFCSIVFVIIVPVLTMRVIAEERKQKTDQLLYSLPISTSQVVFGKFLALIIVYLIPVCIISFYPLIFAEYGEVYLLTAYGSIFAFFIMGIALISVGLFISSLTDNQGFAAGIGIAVILLNYFSVTLSEYVSSTTRSSMIAIIVLSVAIAFVIGHVTQNDYLGYGVGGVLVLATFILYVKDSSKLEGLLPALMTRLSLFKQFSLFINGVFDLKAIVYFVSVIVFFLFLTVQSLEKRRYN